MTERGASADRGALAIGGTTMVGLGVGFIFLRINIFLFLTCLLSGIGLGLVIAALLPEKDA